MKKKYIYLICISTLVVVIDQLLKILIHTNYRLGESTAVIENFFNITYVRNSGAAFGFLHDSPPMFREIFFLSIPPIAMIFILSLFKTVKEDQRWQIWALSSIFGGAIGNYIDRLQYRYVIDFLDFHIQNKYSWPAFNVADMAIVGGVGVLMVLYFQESKMNKKANAN